MDIPSGDDKRMARKWFALIKPIIVNNLDNIDGVTFELASTYRLHYPHLNSREILQFVNKTLECVKSSM